MEEIPAFGLQEPGVVYQERPGSYGLCFDDRGLLAVLRTPGGRLYLPGGGADPGETPEETLAREIREECGRMVARARLLCRATQFVHARGEGYFVKRCTFFLAELEDGASVETSENYTPLWMPADRAAGELYSESQRWAVRQAANAP